MRYARDLNKVLEPKGICFAEDLIALTKSNFVKDPDPKSREWSVVRKDFDSEQKEMLRKAKEQLRVFALIEQAPSNPAFQEKKVTTSGKHRGMPDDIAMAIQMAVHFSNEVVLQPGFNDTLRRSGRRLLGL